MHYLIRIGITQGKQYIELRIVLGQPPVARLFVFEDVFDNVKGMFDLGTHLCLECLVGWGIPLAPQVAKLPNGHPSESTDWRNRFSNDLGSVP